MTSKQAPTVQELWSVPFSVGDLPDAGTHRNLEADAATRERIAKATGLRNVTKLVASFDLAPKAGERVHVTGQVLATVGQTCVVTLEPLDSPIDEAVDVMFSPDPAEVDPEPAAETEDPNRHGSWEADPPEPIVNGTIDLGALAVELMVLGIDTYPRKEGAALPPAVEKAAAEANPFAALAALKGKKGD